MLEMEFLKEVQDTPKLSEEYGDGKTEILAGKLVETVFLDAVQNSSEPIFGTEMLGLALQSEIPELFDNLKTSLLDKYGDQSWSWLVLINLELYPKPNDVRTISQKMASFSAFINTAMNFIKNQEFLGQILKLLQEISENHQNLQNQVAETAFQVLKIAQNQGILTEGQSEILTNFE